MLSKDRSTFAPFAGVAELADARDLKSRATKVAYRFDPGHRHQLFKYRGVEQLVARRAHNPEAAGSSPVSATKSVTVVDTISATVIFYFLLQYR